jgi:IS66 Orf2 like protein
MKILFWDIDGFVLYYKRLEGGTFSWVDKFQIDSTKEISRADFALILAGINPLCCQRLKSAANEVAKFFASNTKEGCIFRQPSFVFDEIVS